MANETYNDVELRTHALNKAVDACAHVNNAIDAALLVETAQKFFEFLLSGTPKKKARNRK